jgi:hypothetical protein
MKPQISKFTYGYALTDELIHWHGTNLSAAPIFPSLYQEGQPSGGYDVMLQPPGVPLFLQFKLADCMVFRSAREVKDHIFQPPYYRMHLRPTRESSQHEMLLALENQGNDVYYSAPAFHTNNDLNNAYFNHQTLNRSLWLRPSQIGPLPDDRPHYVAFQIPGIPHFRSEPRALDTKGDFREFTSRIEDAFRRKSDTALQERKLVDLAETLLGITGKQTDISIETRRISERELAKRHPIDQIAFYAYVSMGCQFFIVREKSAGQR